VIGKLLSSDDATVLATYAQEAADSTEILAAVDKLSRKLREKIGESLRTIRNDRPLAAVTTPSLEALRKYTQAEHAMEVEADVTRGVALLQEAIALDTAFAMAWRKLGIAYANTDAPYAKVLEAQTRAYQHRDRLTDIEKYLTAGSYHMDITEDLGQAEQAYRNALEVQPDNYVALNNIGIVYMGKRDFQRAAEVTGKTLALGPNQFIPYGNLIEVLIALGQVDSAAVVAETMSGAIGEVSPYYYFLGEIAAAKRDYAAVEENARETIKLGGDQYVRVTRMQYAAAMAIQGRLADAERVLAELEQFERTRGEADAGLRHALAAADIDVLIRQDPERAVRRLDAALAREPLDDVSVENRPYIHLAGLFAAGGHPERARTLLGEHAQLPREMRGDDRDGVSQVEGWIALAEQRYPDAISHFRRATTLGACARCEHVELGMAFEGAAQPDSAIAHYEYWLDTPFGDAQIEQDAPRLATVYERLAELHESKGDRQKVALYAGRLVELWKSADSELQPRVAAAHAMLQRLGGDRPR
jgi:tetratricopeptide (TPR) repeat protein